MSIFNYKAFNERKDKIILSCFLTVLVLYLSFTATYFAASANGVRESVVRLHILANSDSEKDQKIKLQVRDELLKTNSKLFSGDVNTENVAEYFEISKDELLKSVKKTLKENGFSYDAEITLTKEYFETRDYGDYTFPAGEYTSLKVVLGEGKGHNWWCVMFPPMCVSVAGGIETDDEKISDYLTESGEKVVSNGAKYVMKFKLLEIFEEIKSKV
ncbi:MAG: stage II sporulation protein R [Acutalibacteraceae bacterium]